MKCKNCQKHVIHCTTNIKGEHHSFNDLPALKYSNGVKEWYKNGKCHRENAPAIEHPCGSKLWYKNGKLHREDAPAIIYNDGSKRKPWYLNGKLITKISNQELYIKKVIQVENQTAIVLKQINDLFWEILLGDEKRLVVAVQ